MTPLRNLIVSLVSLHLAGPVFAEAAADTEELERVRATITTMFPEINSEDIVPSPVKGLYAISKGTIVAYVSGDGRYLMQGDIIDLQTQRNVTEYSRTESRKLIMDRIEAGSYITFSPKKVDYSVVVFTDIDCTYCRRLHRQIQEYMDKGIEVRYLLYPRNGPQTDSWKKAADVWCADDRNSALTAAKMDQEFKTHSCDSDAIGTIFALGQDIGLRGTPAIVFADGTLVAGYLPADQLRRSLDAAASD
jgi:thiol:disulfide interchange protein DsbC